MHIESNTLSGLLNKTKRIIIAEGKKNVSQRGTAWSLDNVTLTWKSPASDKNRYPFWSEKDDNWYQKVFVNKSNTDLPEDIVAKNKLLFPYKYSHRSRYYDSGFGYLLKVVRAVKQVDTSHNDFEKMVN